MFVNTKSILAESLKAVARAVPWAWAVHRDWAVPRAWAGLCVYLSTLKSLPLSLRRLSGESGPEPQLSILLMSTQIHIT